MVRALGVCVRVLSTRVRTHRCARLWHNALGEDLRAPGERYDAPDDAPLPSALACDAFGVFGCVGVL
jgi:hypothetical protein